MVYGVNNYPMYSYMGYTPATFSGAEPYSNAFWFLNEPKKTSQQTTTSKKNVQQENSQPKNTFTIRNRVNQNAVQENKNSAGGYVAAGAGAIAAFELLKLGIAALTKGKVKLNSLKPLAKLRVDNNVVKRNILKMDHIIADANKFVANQKLNTGDKLWCMKYSDLAKFNSEVLPEMGLRGNSVVVARQTAKGKNEILKIYDSTSIDDGLITAFRKNPQFCIKI